MFLIMSFLFRWNQSQISWAKIKGEPSWRSITGPISRNGTKIYRQQFFCVPDFSSCLFKNWCLKSCKNMTVSAAMLCLALCVSEVMNKASMCGNTINYVKRKSVEYVMRKSIKCVMRKSIKYVMRKSIKYVMWKSIKCLMRKSIKYVIELNLFCSLYN